MHVKTVELADLHFNEGKLIDEILGADVFEEVNLARSRVRTNFTTSADLVSLRHSVSTQDSLGKIFGNYKNFTKHASSQIKSLSKKTIPRDNSHSRNSV